MQDLILMLPQIFCYMSGILIALGGFTIYQLVCIIVGAKHAKRGVRKSDAWILAFVSFVTGVLTLALFVFPDFTAQFMDFLVVFEFWYMAFLYCLHHEYEVACVLFTQSVKNGSCKVNGPDRNH